MKELNQQIENDEISVKELILKGKEIWQFLLRKWVIIIVFVIIGASIGVIKAWTTKAQYTAQLTFTLENENSSPMSSYSGLAAMAGIDLGAGGGSLFSSSNIMSLLTSRKMIVNALLSSITVDNKKITLIEYWLSFNPVRNHWYNKPETIKLKFPLNLNPDSLTKKQNGLLNSIYSLMSNTVLKVTNADKKLSFMSASCTSSSELFSKVFLETLNNQVTDFYILTKTKRQKENVDLLQNRADSLYSVLSNSMYRSASLADQNLNMARQVAGVDRQKKQIDLQVASTAYTEVIRNLEVAKMTLQQDTPLIQIIDQPVFPLQKVEASKLNGLLVGGFLAGFLIVGLLLGQKYYKEMIKEE